MLLAVHERYESCSDMSSVMCQPCRFLSHGHSVAAPRAAEVRLVQEVCLMQGARCALRRPHMRGKAARRPAASHDLDYDNNPDACRVVPPARRC